MYADSAFYDDPEHKYPTIEEQIKMARNVARSLLAPANKRARGHTMFVKRRERSDKWVAGQRNMAQDCPSEDDEKYYRPDPWSNSHTWQPSSTPTVPMAPPQQECDTPVNSWKAPVLPSVCDSKEHTSSLSANEFEKIRLFDKKSTHDQISPAMCFSLADDLRKMKGRGGALFAKKRANAEKWAVKEQVDTPEPSTNMMQKILMETAASKPPTDVPVNRVSAVGPSSYNNTGYSSNTSSGPRLAAMIQASDQACTPWEAALDYGGDVGRAFDHLNSDPSVHKQLKSNNYDSFAGKTKSLSGIPPTWCNGSNNEPPVLPSPSQPICKYFIHEYINY